MNSVARLTDSRPLVGSVAGIGLRSQHHLDVLSESPAVGWLEVHSENYFAAGGARVACLERILEQYPLSLHGVGLSLGSTDPLNAVHLEQLKKAAKRFKPVRVSEHLSWSSTGGRFANDLLPLPYTEEAIHHVAGRIRDVQDYLDRQILIENVSSYIEFSSSQLTEWEFLAAVAAESDCAILLDINNIFVASQNHDFDSHQYLQAIPRERVQEFHLAGHSRVLIEGRDLLIDTHSAAVCEEVWALYSAALSRFGPLPTLIEWDAEIPSLAVLVAEAHKAETLARSFCASTD